MNTGVSARNPTLSAAPIPTIAPERSGTAHASDFGRRANGIASAIAASAHVASRRRGSMCVADSNTAGVKMNTTAAVTPPILPNRAASALV